MAGFSNDSSLREIVVADNVDFTGNTQASRMITTDGQLLIGATVSPNIRTGNLTSTGGTVTITNGAGSINVEVTSGGAFVWSDTSGTVTAVSQHGYFISAAATVTLPAAPSEGDTVRFVVDTASALVITAAGTQLIRVGNTISAAGGTSTNTARGDAMELVYRTVGTTWFAASSPVGAWTTV